MRYQRFASSVTLSCVVLAFSLAACTSTSPEEGGSAGVEANVTLAFPPNGTSQFVDEACGTIVCTGIDPILGVPRPSAADPEEFCIDLSTTEGPEPKNPVGLLAKRGLSAPGDCTIFLHADSTDGTTACEDEVTFPVEVNKTAQVSMVLNCITDPQYGGVDVDGEFNQCPVYRQILVTPTLQSTGNDFTVRTEVYDADDDNAEVIVESSCGGAITPTAQVRQSCEDADGAKCDAALTAVTCGTPGNCTITVTVAATLADEVDGCDGFLPNSMSNDAARQVIDVTCQAPAACGNGVIDAGEQCDPPGETLPTAFCDEFCQDIDNCLPNNPCPQSECNPQTCSGDPVTNDPVCADDIQNGATCDVTPGSGLGDGNCSDTGMCVAGFCDATTPCPAVTCAVNTCNLATNTCVADSSGTDGDTCADDGAGNQGTCQAGTCTNPCDIGPVDCAPFNTCTAGTCGDAVTSCTDDFDCPAVCETSACQRTGTPATNQGTCQDVFSSDTTACAGGGTCDGAGNCVVAPACGDGILQGPSTSPAYAGENCDDGNTDPIVPSDPGGTFCDPANAGADCLSGTCDNVGDAGGQACGNPGGDVCLSNDDCPVEGQVCDIAQVGVTPAGTCIAYGDTAAGPCPFGDRTSAATDRGQTCTVAGVCLPKSPSCLPFAGDQCSEDCQAIGKVLPAVCRNSFVNTLSNIPFFNAIDPGVPVTANDPINATVTAAGAIDPAFLQGAAITLFTDNAPATQLTQVIVTLSQDTVVARSGATGSNLVITKADVPDTVPVPFIVNPAAGGESCNPLANDLAGDCPAFPFLQSCLNDGSGNFVCEACSIATCAIIVTGGVSVPLGSDTNTWTAGADPGPVVFDTNGCARDPAGDQVNGTLTCGPTIITDPWLLFPIGTPEVEDTWISVVAGPAGVNIACTGGVVNENGTPCPTGEDFNNLDCADDFVDPALEDDLITFTIWP